MRNDKYHDVARRVANEPLPPNVEAKVEDLEGKNCRSWITRCGKK
jgi:hypothetical protein